MSQSRPYRIVYLLIVTLFVAACGADPVPVEDPPQTEPDMPPGFLDEPPPGPVSATTVFSGAMLLTTDVKSDAVVVVQNGRLLSSGLRGEVEMPNDSVGLDMRNRWIVPGRQADLETGNLPNLDLWRTGSPANLLILDADPRAAPPTADSLIGVVVDGEIRLFDKS